MLRRDFFLSPSIFSILVNWFTLTSLPFLVFVIFKKMLKQSPNIQVPNLKEYQVVNSVSSFQQTLSGFKYPTGDYLFSHLSPLALFVAY